MDEGCHCCSVQLQVYTTNLASCSAVFNTQSFTLACSPRSMAMLVMASGTRNRMRGKQCVSAGNFTMIAGRRAAAPPTSAAGIWKDARPVTARRVLSVFQQKSAEIRSVPALLHNNSIINNDLVHGKIGGSPEISADGFAIVHPSVERKINTPRQLSAAQV